MRKLLQSIINLLHLYLYPSRLPLALSRTSILYPLMILVGYPNGGGDIPA